MTAQDHQEPATAAGRRLADLIDNDDMILDTGAYLVSLIEKEAAEAAARQVTELRAAVEAWPESWTRTIGAKFVRNRILDLLSAWDKAEAPPTAGAKCPLTTVHHHMVASGVSVQFQPGHPWADVPAQYR